MRPPLLCISVFVCLWWAIYRESRGIIVPLKIWKQIESICLNLESSLAARLESASAKLGSVDLLICFDSFQIIERSPLIFLLVLGELRDYGKQLPNLISDLISIRFDLE